MYPWLIWKHCCRPDWSCTLTEIYLCLSSAGIEGVHRYVSVGLFFLPRILLCGTGWTESHYVAQASLEPAVDLLPQLSQSWV